MNGYFVRPRNSHDIADKVNKILASPDKAKLMGENARKLVAEKFTWNKIAKRFLAIYKSYAVNFNGKNKK